MKAILLLIPISFLVVTVAAWLLLWAIRSGQYQDLENRMPDNDDFRQGEP